MRNRVGILVGLALAGCGGATAPSDRATYRDVTAGGVPAVRTMSEGPIASAGSTFAFRRSFDGIAGGPIEAMGWDGACRGWIPETPQIQLDLPTPTPLSVAATSAVDTTMVVVFPDGRIACNDDTNGLNPQVTAEFVAGHYRIYIGTYSAENGGAPFHVEIGPPS